MRTLLIDDEPETRDTVEAPTAADLQRRWHLHRLIGVQFACLGLFLQWLLPTTTLRCEAPASGHAACVVSDRILIGLMPTETEALAGVRAARIEVQRARDTNRHRIVLQTTAGSEREMTFTFSYVAAHQLAGTINQRLRADAAFEAALGFAFEDWAMRTFALIVIAGGAGLAIVGQIRYRRSRGTQPCG